MHRDSSPLLDSMSGRKSISNEINRIEYYVGKSSEGKGAVDQVTIRS